MKIYILSAIIVILLINEVCTDEQNNQNSLITTYDPGEASSETPIGSGLPSYEQVTAVPDHGHIRFEDQSSQGPLKFDDKHKENEYIDVDQADPGSVLVDIAFDNEESSNQNDRIFNTETFENDSNNENPENKIKFEGRNDEQDSSEDGDDGDEDDNPQSDTSQVVFEDEGDDTEYSEESETEIDTTDKPIKFENQDDDSNNRDTDRNTVTERVIFKYDNNNQQPVQKKKRLPRRKPRLQTKQSDPAPTAPSTPYPGLGYPGYPGVGYPGPGYPGPGDPNAGYPAYPMPNYPTPGYPYPGYPTPYPGMAYPTPGYPGYSPYPTPPYPPVTPGYGAYPPSGYPAPGDQRPPANPVSYPNPGQGEPSGQFDNRYPNQDYGGPQPSAPQAGQPGASYPGPEYPYHQGYPPPGYPQAYPGDPNSQYPVQSPPQYRPPGHPWPHQHGIQSGHNRPSRRPKSLTQRAVSAVAEALTSIALYDDYQCVPRILCEVAGGGTASSPTLQKASASLQPLLSLLQAYNGVSTSPLFIFARAAVTGMTAKGNPSACYRAYPQCPSDPEKLINYLNNHNGGFFRFFGLPEAPQQPQNLEQFYNYLSGQNGFQQQPQQNYGYPSPYGYGLQAQHAYPPHQSHPYNYGHNYYHGQSTYRNSKNIDSEIEERIQNKPGVSAVEDNEQASSVDKDKGQVKDSKWSFPDEVSTKKDGEREKVKIKKQPERPSRVSKTLKFPDDRSDDMRQTYRPRDYRRKGKKISFPGQSHFQNIISAYQTTTPVNPGEYVFDHKHNFYIKRPKSVKSYDVVDVVYVVRGNGDPNHPEIVKVRPGQSV